VSLIMWLMFAIFSPVGFIVSDVCNFLPSMGREDWQSTLNISKLLPTMGSESSSFSPNLTALVQNCLVGFTDEDLVVRSGSLLASLNLVRSDMTEVFSSFNVSERVPSGELKSALNMTGHLSLFETLKTEVNSLNASVLLSSGGGSCDSTCQSNASPQINTILGSGSVCSNASLVGSIHCVEKQLLVVSRVADHVNSNITELLRVMDLSTSASDGGLMAAIVDDMWTHFDSCNATFKKYNNMHSSVCSTLLASADNFWFGCMCLAILWVPLLCCGAKLSKRHATKGSAKIAPQTHSAKSAKKGSSSHSSSKKRGDRGRMASMYDATMASEVPKEVRKSKGDAKVKKERAGDRKSSSKSSSKKKGKVAPSKK